MVTRPRVQEANVTKRRKSTHKPHYILQCYIHPPLKYKITLKNPTLPLLFTNDKGPIIERSSSPEELASSSSSREAFGEGEGEGARPAM